MHGGTADTRQRLAGCEPGQKLRTTVRAVKSGRMLTRWFRLKTDPPGFGLVVGFGRGDAAGGPGRSQISGPHGPILLEVADFTCMCWGSSAPGS
jgi:hypothetical protein